MQALDPDSCTRLLKWLCPDRVKLACKARQHCRGVPTPGKQAPTLYKKDCVVAPTCHLPTK